MSEEDNLFEDDIDESFLLAASTSTLTDAQKNRAEKNRLKAVALKKARLLTKPDQEQQDFLTGDKLEKKRKKVETKLVDTNAGFFIEETPGEVVEAKEESKPLPAPVLEPDRPECLDCGEDLADSYLFRTFDHEVCDKCRNTEKDGKHELITKTDAKNEFLLKDFHFEQDPPLKFILRKNPHNPRWGDMKLYLRLQVEERALKVWGDEEVLEDEHQKREDKKEQAKVKKFNKKLKALRMQVRGSLYKKDFSAHEHDYGEEVYDEEEDEYSKTCSTCGHKHCYEKM